MKIKYLLLPIALVAICSCNNSETVLEEQLGKSLEHVSLGVSDLSFDEDWKISPTRSAIDIGPSGISFSWSEDDIVGMFPDKGAPAYFEMASHQGESVAEFDGGGWALKSASKYAVYYPYSYEHRVKENIPFQYTGQRQIGKNQYSHLNKFQFLASGAVEPVAGACNYSMDRIEAVVWFQLTLPMAASYNKLTIRLKDGTPIVISSILNIADEDYVITPDKTNRYLSMDLENITTTSENEVVNFYIMLPPQNMAGKKLIVSVNTVDGDCCMAEIDGKNMVNNKAYKFTAELESDYGSRSMLEKIDEEEGKWTNE